MVSCTTTGRFVSFLIVIHDAETDRAGQGYRDPKDEANQTRANSCNHRKLAEIGIGTGRGRTERSARIPGFVLDNAG